MSPAPEKTAAPEKTLRALKVNLKWGVAWHPVGLPHRDLRLRVAMTCPGQQDGGLHPGAAGSR